MNLKRLLFIQAIVTFATFLVLVIAPAAIPASFGIGIKPEAYFLCYSIGAAELSLAYLSIAARKFRDMNALRFVCIFFIVFHAATGLLGLYAILQGAPIKIMGNVALRIIMASLFVYYGVYKNRNGKNRNTVYLLPAHQ